MGSNKRLTDKDLSQKIKTAKEMVQQLRILTVQMQGPELGSRHPHKAGHGSVHQQHVQELKTGMTAGACWPPAYVCRIRLSERPDRSQRNKAGRAGSKTTLALYTYADIPAQTCVYTTHIRKRKQSQQPPNNEPNLKIVWVILPGSQKLSLPMF